MFRWMMGMPFSSRFEPFRMRGCFKENEGGTAGTGGGDEKGGDGKENKSNEQPFATFPDESTFMARMKREGKAQVEAMAKELGFDSSDALKVAAKAQKEADEAAKTELEKEKARAEKAESDKKMALDAANTRLVNAEIKVFAVQAGFIDPADAVALIDRAGIQVDEQGAVTGAKEAVEALAKTKPHLVGTEKPGGSPGGAGNVGRQDGGKKNPWEEGQELAKKRNEAKKATNQGW
ncbi:MAG: hypothetical protein MJA84_07235 [Firmicutes bacterium]|nr:hypothetical protein [Bacillota bacterium]